MDRKVLSARMLEFHSGGIHNYMVKFSNLFLFNFLYLLMSHFWPAENLKKKSYFYVDISKSVLKNTAIVYLFIQFTLLWSMHLVLSLQANDSLHKNYICRFSET